LNSTNYKIQVMSYFSFWRNERSEIVWSNADQYLFFDTTPLVLNVFISTAFSLIKIPTTLAY